MPLHKEYLTEKKRYKVTFALEVDSLPKGSDVKLVGDFNNWSLDKAPTLKIFNGQYKVYYELQAGQPYEYRYMVDNNVWHNDPQADGYKPSPYPNVDNCVVNLPIK